MIDLPTFLAHAIALEAEAAERNDEIADSLELHNNREVSDLFRKLAHFSRLHRAEIEERAKGIALPTLHAWEFQWVDSEGPETTPFAQIHYLMTPYHAVRLALHNERRGRDYYAAIAAQASSDDIRTMALEMADEESEHVAILEEWAKRYPEPPADWDNDPDLPRGGD